MLQGNFCKSQLSHPSLHVTRNQAVVEPRRLYRLSGLSPANNLGINNGDIGTLECALLERMYYCKVGNVFASPPQPDRKQFATVMSDFRRSLLRKVGTSTPRSLEEVVEMYKGRKRTIYSKALEDVHRFGLKRSDAYSCSFVKVEKVACGKAPRCIQPRKPKYNLVLGRYIKHLEHRVYRAIGKMFGGPTVMKGYTVHDVARIIHGKWSKFKNPAAVGLDAAKFDMHVSEAALAWEHSIYMAVYNNCPELRELLLWQMDNVGRGYCVDGKLKYRVRGRRFSGDMNTALGNCLIMCGLVWVYAKKLGIEIQLVNNGDDCTVIMEAEDVDRFRKGLDSWFLGMGFRMVAEDTVYELEQIEFCQMHPIHNGEEWVMVRNIPTALSKDCCSVLPLDKDGLDRKWMYCVGECGLSLTSGIPVLQSFYRALMRNGCSSVGALRDAPQMNSGLRMMWDGVIRKSRRIHPATRCAVFKAWGLTPDEQVSLEEYYDNWTYTGAPTDIEHIPPLFYVF